MISKTLYKWYDENKRQHPWLGSGNAYHIWLSEVIMQQTRIGQGTSYFLKFIERFKTIQSLSRAEETEVLKMWEGLGYYSRARNMLHTAIEICDKYRGKFPDKYDDLIRLKGIGSYTASAILSFAYHKPFAVVDGNVIRILSRIYGIIEPADSPNGKKIFSELAQKNLDKHDPAKYNQAIMDFGALICTPKPKCELCPFQKKCFAFIHGKEELLPVKNKKAKKKTRYFNFLVLTDGKKLVITKREQKDIWFNLYQFPLFESKKQLSKEVILRSPSFGNLIQAENKMIIHSIIRSEQELTHQKIKATFCLVETDIGHIPSSVKVSQVGLGKYAFPGVIRNYLKEIPIFKS